MARRGTVSEVWDADQGAYPAGLEPTRTFGPQVEALLGYFHERHHVSHERLVEVCRELFGLRLSEGGIDNALRRLAEWARPIYDAIGAQVRAGPVIGSNETGARVGGGPPGTGHSRRRRRATTSSSRAGTLR